MGFLQECNKYLRYWQKRLGLSDWQIFLEVRRVLHQPDAAAEVDVTVTQQRAVIYLLAPEVYREMGFDDVQDPEFQILHELLHVKLWFFQPSQEDRVAWVLFEQAINGLARALLEARYDTPPN